MAVMVLSLGFCMPSFAVTSFDPSNASIVQLRMALDSGALTSSQLVQFYLDRIRRHNHAGAQINALITLNPDAPAQARQRDAQRHTARRTLLYGIPFVAKDNYDTAGIATSGGAAALKTSRPSANAFVVQRLLDEGAILLGKANMSELAASYGRLGYSSAGGQVRNPYNTLRDVSGSSSGSAAAVAADFAAFALGTDTGGSVRAPASVAGLVGLRPTLGLTSRSGVIPLALSFDTTGILARTARDVAIVLDAIAGADSQDPATSRQPAHPSPYAKAFTANALHAVRIGVVGNFRGANADVDRVETAALARLAGLGAVLVPVTLPRRFEDLWASLMGPVGEAEFKPQFERYLRTLEPSQPNTLRQVITISQTAAIAGSPTPVNPGRLQGLEAADASQATDSPAYLRLVTEDIPEVRRTLQSLMADRRLQILVFSTMSCPATPRYDALDPTYFCRSEDPYQAGYVAAAAGFPEVTVPAGRVAGNLPVGISFLGLPYTEARLLDFANAFQPAGPHVDPPPLD